MKVTTIADLLWHTEVTPAGCRLWTRNRSTGGYGQLRHRGRMTYAHRLAYEMARAPIPPGLTVDHLCFTPACVNPDHLRLLTASENSRNQRGARPTACAAGHVMDAPNTYIDRQDKPHCRACRRAAHSRYQQRTSS